MTNKEIRLLAEERFGNHPHVFGGQRDGFVEGFKKAMELVKNNAVLPLVSHCGLTEIEYAERERLFELQRSTTRWFSQQEFDKLKELSNKMFKNAGSPHCG